MQRPWSEVVLRPFGIENKVGVFPIHPVYKFNPVIVQKGSVTDAICTAFMHRNLADWEVSKESWNCEAGLVSFSRRGKLTVT